MACAFPIAVWQSFCELLYTYFYFTLLCEKSDKNVWVCEYLRLPWFNAVVPESPNLDPLDKNWLCPHRNYHRQPQPQWILPARRYVFAVIACLSVCPSVRSQQAGIVSKRLNVRFPKQRHTISQGRDKRFYKPLMRSPPTGVPNAGGVRKNCVFRPVEKSPTHTLYRQKFVSTCYIGPRPRRCAGWEMRGVINNFDVSRRLLITLIRPRWHQQ